jgi:hypothetical protein
MPFSKEYSDIILNYIFGKSATIVERPEKIEIGLTTVNPETVSKESEITDNELDTGSNPGYKRLVIFQKTIVGYDAVKDANGSYTGKFTPRYGEGYPFAMLKSSNRQILNQVQLTWDKAKTDWERINGFFLVATFDDNSTKTFFYGTLDLSQEDKENGGLLVSAGSVALFEPGMFGLSFMETDYKEPLTDNDEDENMDDPNGTDPESGEETTEPTE